MEGGDQEMSANGPPVVYRKKSDKRIKKSEGAT